MDFFRYLTCLPLLILLTTSCQQDTEPQPEDTSNSAPRVDRISVLPSTEALPGDVIYLSAEVSDPDGDPVLSQWTSSDGVFADPLSLTTTFTVPDKLGPLPIKLRLTDDHSGETVFSLTMLVGYQATDDEDNDGFTWEQGDCNDLDSMISPDNPEIVDGKDNNCNGLVDENSFVSDDDGDRWSELDGDCNDADPNIYPNAPEGRDLNGDDTLEGDGIDNDCDGFVDEGTDQSDDDGDGYSEEDGDCLDLSVSVYPQAQEIADGLDNDCDGSIDEGTANGDDDGDGFAENGGDCDDEDPNTYPTAPELIDSIDNNCNGIVDEGSFFVDDDHDGYSESEQDCDDDRPDVYPGALETADGVDNNCNGLVDELTPRSDDDGDGFSETQGDCNDQELSVYPGADEQPDAIDNNCNGIIDEGTALFDNDGDGYSQVDGDCNDLDPVIYPGATEYQDWSDNDCDTIIDEGTYRYDDDNDGFTESEGDCDDTRPDVYPGAEEVIDGTDNNCDGVGDPNLAPVALVTVETSARTCDEIALDGTASYDPDGGQIRQFLWFVSSKPETSQVTNAWIEDQDADYTYLVTDVPGDYSVGLIVSDGTSSSQAQYALFSVEDRGFNDDPIAEAGPDQLNAQSVICSYAGENEERSCPPCDPWTANLDGAKSSDPDGDRLFYEWTISSSTATDSTLSGANSATPSIRLAAPPAEYGRTNTYTLFVKLEVRDCQYERDVDSVLVSYSCTGK